MQVTLRPYQERFWKYVRKTRTCWLWVGSKNARGYGQMGLGRRSDGTALSHRISWMIHRGCIPKGMLVCHKCDVPACVNPNHLFLGTDAINTADMRAKGRGKLPPVSFAPNHPFCIGEMAAKKVIALRSKGLSYRKIAERAGCSASTVCNIVNSRTWVRLR